MTEQVDMLTYVEAMSAAFLEEMRRDERVVMWGEDIVSMGGVFRETTGVFNEFGEDRIKDTPIVEQAIVGMSVGAALTGLRPVVHVMFAAFLSICFDGVFMELGSYARSYGYKGPVPVVVFTTIAAGLGFDPGHCTSPEALLVHSPGLKVVLPSTAYDAKGLLKAAIRDDGPVVFMPHRNLYFGEKQPIPTEEYLIPLGKADVKRQGNDVTIVTYSAMVGKALAAAEALSKEGIDVEVVDLRSLVPLDVKTIVASVKKTGRLLIVCEAMTRGGAAGEIAFRLNEAAPDVVKALSVPIRRLGAKNVALPHMAPLVETGLVPQVDDVVKTVKEMV